MWFLAVGPPMDRSCPSGLGKGKGPRGSVDDSDAVQDKRVARRSHCGNKEGDASLDPMGPSAPSQTRTDNLRIRSPPLYPLSYGGMIHVPVLPLRPVCGLSGTHACVLYLPTPSHRHGRSSGERESNPRCQLGKLE